VIEEFLANGGNRSLYARGSVEAAQWRRSLKRKFSPNSEAAARV